MKLDLFKEKYFDLIIINNTNIAYFQIGQERTKINILKSEKFDADVFSQGIFHLSNLQPVLDTLFKKYKLTEVGIVLNTPNIIFSKIIFPRSSISKEAIENFLKTNFPLPIERYTFFYREDKYRSLSSSLTLDIFFIEKEIIERLLDIIEKYEATPLFITSSIETFYRYLFNRAVLDFNEEYLVFFQAENTLIIALIKNFRLEKVITEELNHQNSNLSLIINRIYNFLKQELQPQTKIICFSQEKIELSLDHQTVFISLPVIDILLEGSYYVFKDILLERPLIDFMPVKNYKAYLLNRLPSILTLLSIYTSFLLILTTIVYFSLQSYFNKEIKNLSFQIKTINPSQNETNLQTLKDIISSLQPDIFNKFSLISQIKNLPGIENIKLEDKILTFSLKTEPDNSDKIKLQINQYFPEVKLIEELISENEVKLTYTFQQ